MSPPRSLPTLAIQIHLSELETVAESKVEHRNPQVKPIKMKTSPFILDGSITTFYYPVFFFFFLPRKDAAAHNDHLSKRSWGTRIGGTRLLVIQIASVSSQLILVFPPPVYLSRSIDRLLDKEGAGKLIWDD